MPSYLFPGFQAECGWPSGEPHYHTFTDICLLHSGPGYPGLEDIHPGHAHYVDGTWRAMPLERRFTYA